MRNENRFAAIVSLFTLGVYWATLAPSVQFIDSGELAAVCATLGIAHPTGYPLFTLLGAIFSQIPLSESIIYRLNLMSAIYSAFAVLLFYKCMVVLLQESLMSTPEMSTKKASTDKKPARVTTEGLLILVSAAAASLTLAFSETFWSHAIAIEVYSLHSLLLLLALFVLLKVSLPHSPGVDQSMEKGARSEPLWLLLAFVMGLGFTNHMTILLLVPGAFVYYVQSQGLKREALQRIPRLITAFLVGLTPYLYLFLRAADSPTLNWGDPSTLERFIRHVTGAQYRVWMFSSAEVAQKQLIYFLSSLPSEVGYVALFLSPFGLWSMYRASRKISLFLLILFGTCVLYSINYDIHDIDSYFLLSHIVTAFCVGFGFHAVSRFLVKKRIGLYFVLTGSIITALVPLFLHYGSQSERDNYLVKDYTLGVFASIEPGGLLLSYQWDLLVAPSLYFQFVEGIREDIVVVDKELLRRSWYFDQLRKNYPWLIQRSKDKVEAFLRELYKFEHSLPYDPQVIEARFVDMINNFVEQNIRDRPVYVTYEIESEITKGYQRVPTGLVFRVYADSLYYETGLPVLSPGIFDREGKSVGQLRQAYGVMYMFHGMYRYGGGRKGEALEAFEKAAKIEEFSVEAARWRQQIVEELGGGR